MKELITLTIQSLVYEGYGLSRQQDGRVVFVPFVLPGETVQVRIIEEKKGHALAELVSVIDPHDQRILPRCVHFGICGGCHYQHIPYALQLEYKQAIFIEQLQRIAGIETPLIKKIFPSTEQWNYRDAMQFKLSESGKLCFSDFYRNRPFEVRECHLPMPEINAFWPKLEFEPEMRLDRLEIRQNNENDLMLVLRGKGMDVPIMESESPISVVHLDGANQVVMAGNDRLMMRVNEKDFSVSGGAFFQTNLAVADLLVKEVKDAVDASGVRTLMDVYCGVGLFSAFLAAELEKVIGIESSIAACNDFAANLDDFDNVSLYEGKAEDVIPFITEKPDCVIVDPPRSGLKQEVTQAIIIKSPKLLIYISCNPSTFARDTRYFVEAGYHLNSSTLIDMFPQTFHIESVNVFSKP
jgi:23S rRNA (uracil1939-C5)-methyltransferase